MIEKSVKATRENVDCALRNMYLENQTVQVVHPAFHNGKGDSSIMIPAKNILSKSRNLFEESLYLTLGTVTLNLKRVSDKGLDSMLSDPDANCYRDAKAWPRDAKVDTLEDCLCAYARQGIFTF